MRTSGWYRVAMFGAMIVVLLNTLFAVKTLHTLFLVQGWRAHTLEVITHTRAIDLEISQGNSAVRAYLLTGYPSYVERFHQAKGTIDSELVQLQKLTIDNPAQQNRILYLKKRILIKRAALETAVAMRSGMAGPLDMTALQPSLSDSPDGLPSVYYCIDRIEEEEQRLLNDRTREVHHAEVLVWVSFFSASLLDIFLLAAAAELLIRVLRDRQTLADRAAEIALLNTDLEKRVELRTRELESSNKELEAFSYSVSHDLRAPLRTIDGFSLALQEDFADKLSGEGQDYINRVRAGVQRMGSLIDALLQLSRVTRTELQHEDIDLSQMATLVFQELKGAEPARSVTFTAQPGLHANGDSRLLRNVLENLIGNALKFTSKVSDPQIEFGGRPGTGELAGKTVYFVQDNGAGFDMQYVDRLFTAFQRLHGDRDFKGSGIGLATVSRIIRRHHGSMGAFSEPGKGANFYFTLADGPIAG
ncbi:sensor histidine kinase [Granulicella paludicola]|uniref:sensor histidine kinase n=1 Tax=Granulicella paludicola TaxID=474951 RepID=UPI0021DFDC70|nr:sensor histidine kinase [Granulicella paludicola]